MVIARHPFTYIQFLITSFLLFTQISFAQNAKSLAKEAKIFQEQKSYEQAVQKYSAALELKPTEAEWLAARANCYENLKQFKSAASDYKAAMAASPKNADYCERAGDCLFLSGEYAACMEMFARLSNQYFVVSEFAIERIAESRLFLKDFEGAISESNEALNDFKDNEIFYYFRGLAYDSLKNYQSALISYQDAIAFLKNKSSKKKPFDKARMLRYSRSLARVQVLLFQNEEAQKTIQDGLAAFPGDPNLTLLRARVFAEQAAFQKSLDDFNFYLSKDSSDMKVFFERAVVFKRLGQFLNAANDLSRIIEKNDTASNAYEMRARCYEDIGNYRKALTDFQKFKQVAKPSQKLRSDNALKRIEAKLYEKEKENNSPKFLIRSPEVIGDDMSVAKSASFVIIKGIVDDESLIKTISADGVEAEFSRDSLNPSFRVVVNVLDKEELSIKITDIYLNAIIQKFKFSRAEKKAPELQLFIPVSTVSSEIFHDPAHEPVLKVIGKVNDESYISQIEINGYQVNFDTRQLNPEFSYDIKVGSHDSVRISLTDEYGNKSIHRFIINAKEAAAIRNNPMGRTWLVFVENSDYLDFEKLDGPSKDAGTIKFALADYRFDNIITKRNMTLQALDRFFRIELRDLVKQQHVNSVLIWFAGHGKFLNGSGYWIPSDAKKNDEASYFPISNLKGYLENYGSLLQHILIVSDACESGDAFRISDQTNSFKGTCADPKSKDPASIVFSSTSSEKASDNSLFAKTFATALQGNTSACISLSDIAAVVGEAVEKNQRQNTRIGLIKGLPNKGGTFLFVKSLSR